MIYTVTLNPAIDYVVNLDTLTPGALNRAQGAEIFFGGKGINVSLVLKTLGFPSRALGFTAGFTGRAIREGLEAQGVETDFVHLERGFSRINVKILSGAETEINGQGPEIPSQAVTALFDKLDALGEGDILVLSGSVPGSLPPDLYGQILARLAGKQVRTVVDAAKDLLLNALKYRPFLVKPNLRELGELFGVTLSTRAEIVEHGKKLQAMGAGNVLVSLGAQGAILVDDQGEVHTCPACRGTPVNSVGAGDSMVAGFLAGLVSGDYRHALKLATAAGGATAFSPGLAQKDLIARLLARL